MSARPVHGKSPHHAPEEPCRSALKRCIEAVSAANRIAKGGANRYHGAEYDGPEGPENHRVSFVLLHDRPMPFVPRYYAKGRLEMPVPTDGKGKL